LRYPVQIHPTMISTATILVIDSTYSMYPDEYRYVLGRRYILWAEDIHAQARLILLIGKIRRILDAGEPILCGILRAMEGCWWTGMGKSPIITWLSRIVDSKPSIHWRRQRLLGQSLVNSRAHKAPIAGKGDCIGSAGYRENGDNCGCQCQPLTESKECHFGVVENEKNDTPSELQHRDEQHHI
jgi:hypothetical protein